MKLTIECSCGVTYVAADPTELWDALREHTTPRVEPIPGVRHVIELHDTHAETDDGMRLW